MDRKPRSWFWRVWDDLKLQPILYVAGSGSALLWAAIAAFAAHMWSFSPWWSASGFAGLLLLSVAAVVLWRGKPEWDSERARRKAAEEMAERLVALFRRADRLIETAAREQHGPVAEEQWFTAVKETIRLADVMYESSSIPRDISLLIYNPVNRPKYKDMSSTLNDRDTKVFQALRLIHIGLAECTRAFREREGLKIKPLPAADKPTDSPPPP